MRKFKIVLTHKKEELHSYYLFANSEEQAIDKAKYDLPYVMVAEKIKFSPCDIDIVAIEEITEFHEVDVGSYGAGVCLGLFLNLLGLIIALCVGGQKTKTGALIIIIIEFVIALFFFFLFGL